MLSVSEIAPVAHEVIEAATNVAHTTATDPKVDVGFTWTAAGVWTLVGTAILSLIKILPPLAKLLLDRDDAVRGEKRVDRKTQGDRIAELEERSTRTLTAIGSLMNAIMVGIDGLEQEDHNDRMRAAKQMRRHVDMAVSVLGKDDPFMHALAELSKKTGGATRFSDLDPPAAAE